MNKQTNNKEINKQISELIKIKWNIFEKLLAVKKKNGRYNV